MTCISALFFLFQVIPSRFAFTQRIFVRRRSYPLFLFRLALPLVPKENVHHQVCACATPERSARYFSFASANEGNAHLMTSGVALILHSLSFGN